MAQSTNLPWYLDLSRRGWEQYDKLPVLVVDLETTNKDHGDPRTPENRIVKVAALVSEDEVVTTSAGAWEMIELSSGKPLIFVAHNAKFELGWLNRLGIDTSQWLPWDTMIAEFVLAGNRSWDLSLDGTSRRYGLGSKGRVIDALMKGGVCPSEHPAHLLERRVVWDVDHTYRLFRLQFPKLRDAGLLPVMFTRCILTPVLAQIEPHGMQLDPVLVQAEYERLVARRAELKAKLTEIGEGRKLKGPQLADLVYTHLGFEELTGRDGSPLRTDTGRPKTDADTLLALVAKTPEQREFLKLYREYNSVDAAITKNLEFFRMVCEERGGRFVANFNQTVTQTHRLSSSGKRTTFSDGKARSVQFQNFPRKYKGLFTAPPGYVLAEADGAQLEFRVGGSLSRDPQVLHDVLTGADVHRFSASVMLRKPESEVTKEQRNKAKPDTFKPMYGGQSGTPRQKEYYEAFRRKYHVMFDTQTGWTMTVLKDKKLRTASGLIFYWPDTVMKSGGYIVNTPSIFNYPVQSLATAEIIPVSIVYTFWTARARGLDVRIVNTVHDSVIAEVAEKDVDSYREVVVESFLDRTYEYMHEVYGIDLYVPLGVDFRAGTHWGDGEEIKVSYPPKQRTLT